MSKAGNDNTATVEIKAAEDNILLELKGVCKTYHQGGKSLEVLKNVDLILQRGEMVGLVGPSGAGKSTLLHIIGLLDKPDSGAVMIKGKDSTGLADNARTALRRKEIGFVYQFHHLQPEFSAEENIMLPQMLDGVKKQAAREKALSLLDTLGLKERADHRPAQLSGGEQQRVAIARALANDPAVLLADEPTGNLDQDTGDRAFELFTDLVRDAGIGALVATHNIDLADRMDHVLELRNGRLKLY